MVRFRINVTHIFMAGGKVGPFIIKDNFDGNETAAFATISSDGDYFVSKANRSDSSGGTPLKKSYLFDGVTWINASPMPTQRVSPVCPLLEMDDGELSNIDQSIFTILPLARH